MFADDERLVGRGFVRGAAADEGDDLDTVAVGQGVFVVPGRRHDGAVDLDGDAAAVVAEALQKLGRRQGAGQRAALAVDREDHVAWSVVGGVRPLRRIRSSHGSHETDEPMTAAADAFPQPRPTHTLSLSPRESREPTYGHTDSVMSSHYVPHTKVPTIVFPSSGHAARHVALMIESLIRQNNSAGRATVLGLPTGSTPVGLYRELIRLHRRRTSTSRASSPSISTNTIPCSRTTPQSYRRWMQETFFNHVNVPPQNIHVPDGTIKPEDAEDYCQRYEQKSAGPAASTCRCWASAAPATSASTNPARRATAARAWSRSTR